MTARRKMRHGTARHVGTRCPILHVPARGDTAASVVLGPPRVEVGVVPRVLGPHDEEHVLRLRHLVSEGGHFASEVVLALLQGEGRADTRGKILNSDPSSNLTSSSLHMAFTELCSPIT